MKGMEKLRLVIGPAPSELPYEDLLARLANERERMTKALHAAKPARKSRRTPSGTPKRRKRQSRKMTKSDIDKFNKLLEGL